MVDESLRRSEFAYLDFRDSPGGRPSYIQGNTLAGWEIILLVRAYKDDLPAVAGHLRWPLAKVKAAAHYAEAFPAEIDEALAENEAADFTTLKRMLPQAAEFKSGKAAKR